MAFAPSVGPAVLAASALAIRILIRRWSRHPHVTRNALPTSSLQAPLDTWLCSRIQGCSLAERRAMQQDPAARSSAHPFPSRPPRTFLSCAQCGKQCLHEAVVSTQTGRRSQARGLKGCEAPFSGLEGGAGSRTRVSKRWAGLMLRTQAAPPAEARRAASVEASELAQVLRLPLPELQQWAGPTAKPP